MVVSAMMAMVETKKALTFFKKINKKNKMQMGKNDICNPLETKM